jgi:hypothetical protein
MLEKVNSINIKITTIQKYNYYSQKLIQITKKLLAQYTEIKLCSNSN